MANDADGLRARPSRTHKASTCEDATVLRSYFKSLALREYDEIFDHESDIVNRVVRPSKQRYLAAILVIVGICLNSFTITRGFLWSVHDQRELYEVFSDRSFLSNFSECRLAKQMELKQRTNSEQHIKAFEESAEHWQAGCNHIKKHSQHLFVCLPAFWEIFMVLQTLLRSMFFLRHVFHLGQRSIEQLSKDNEHRHHMMHEFKTINHGIEVLDGMTCISSITRLPIVQRILPDLILHHNLMRERRGMDGHLAVVDLLIICASDLARLLFKLILFLFAMSALYLKLMAITHLLEEEFIFWNRGEWLAFVGFTFQLANLVKLKKERRDAFLFFVFTGEDAKMQDQEREALEEFRALTLKQLFHKLGAARGFVMAITITSDDLQRIVLTENSKKQSAPSEADIART